MITAMIATQSVEKIAQPSQSLQSLLAQFQPSEKQPIFIAENGEITNVILTYAQYQQLQQPAKISLADAFKDYHEPIAVDYDFQANQKTQFADNFEFD